MAKDKIVAKDLECLFRENYSHYFYYALSFVDDSDIAKDIIGEVFLAVWRNHEHISKERLNSYIYISIRNKSVTQVRHSQMQVNMTEFSKLMNLEEPEEEWRRKEEQIMEVEKIVQEMAPRTRYILEQFYYRHRTYKDVADELGITTDGIKKQLVKAMTILRGHFNINKHKK